MSADNQLHKFNRQTKIIVTKGESRKIGKVITLNPSGSYGVRLDDGRTIEAQPSEVAAFFETDRMTGTDFPVGSYVAPSGAHLPIGEVTGHSADGWPEVRWETETEVEAPTDLVLVESPKVTK